MHPIPKDASSHGCRWPVAATFKLPADTRSGYYSVICQEPGANAGLAAAFFVVRPKEPEKNTKILLQLATNTYNAYTNWGGYSLYAYHGRHKVQGRRVSFDRPLSSPFERWEKGRTGQAVVGTYTRGGTVVTVGSTDWSHGLRGNDPVVTRVTKNVLDKLGK